MKKYILFVLLVLCSLSGFAQSPMTDMQVVDFAQKEYKKGTSQAQTVTKLIQSGADILQIHRVRNIYEKTQKRNAAFRTAKESTIADRSRTNNGRAGPTAVPGRSKQQIVDTTLDDYNDNEQEINRYSEGYIPANRPWTNTYDESDGEYLKVQAEMNDWMP